MKKILISLSVIVAVGAVVAGATGAFFSDTETSTGNTFTAGAIDLQIDNESYAIDYNIPAEFLPPDYVYTGKLMASTHTSWELKDLTIERFFDFIDLKPGDFGEDTISIHVGTNDAWVCAAAEITTDEDNGITEPEDESDAVPGNGSDGTADGDLDDGLQFAFWVDDGDNVYETCDGVGEGTVPNCQSESFFLSGTLAGMGQAGQIALADSNKSILGGKDPIPGGTTFFIGKAWCFGDLAPDAELQDGHGKTSSNGPLDRDTGIACDGSNADNIAQTDSVVGNLEFYAEQSRNNPLFLCSDDRS